MTGLGGFDWGERPDGWPPGMPYPVPWTLGGLWDGRRLVVQGFEMCPNCGHAFDETNSCSDHKGGFWECVILMKED